MIVLEPGERRDYGPSYAIAELPEAMRQDPGLIVRTDGRGREIVPRVQFGDIIDGDGNPVLDPRLSHLVAFIGMCKLPEEVVDALLFDPTGFATPLVETLPAPANIDPGTKKRMAYAVGAVAHAMAYQAGLISVNEFVLIREKLDALKPEE
jgi:hypothetical protein